MPASLSPLVTISMFSMSVYFCFANKFICKARGRRRACWLAAALVFEEVQWGWFWDVRGAVGWVGCWPTGGTDVVAWGIATVMLTGPAGDRTGSWEENRKDSLEAAFSSSYWLNLWKSTADFTESWNRTWQAEPALSDNNHLLKHFISQCTDPPNLPYLVFTKQNSAPAGLSCATCSLLWLLNVLWDTGSVFPSPGLGSTGVPGTINRKPTLGPNTKHPSTPCSLELLLRCREPCVIQKKRKERWFPEMGCGVCSQGLFKGI